MPYDNQLKCQILLYRIEQGGMCMKNNQEKKYLDNWLSITNIQMSITNELESALQKNHNLSLKRVLRSLLFIQNRRKTIEATTITRDGRIKSKCYIQAGSQA